MADYTEYEGFFSGPYIGIPVCWDGGNLHVFESYSNNARYGAVSTVLNTNPNMEGNFTDTVTSDASFTDNSEFVRPGMVPLLTAWDEDLDVYPPVTPSIWVVAGVDAAGITELSRTAFPSDTTSNPGFLKGWTMWPDQPTFYAYGNSGTSYVQGWEATVGADGMITPFTSIGTTTTWPKSGSSFYFSKGSAVTDRWALSQSVSTLLLRFDRLNPLATTNIYSALPAADAGESAAVQFLQTDARAAPGHVLSIRGPYTFPTYLNHVLDLLLSEDGSSFSTVGDWHAPSGTAWTAAGWSSQGKAVAYCLGTDGSSKTGFYDLFGSPIEFPVTVPVSVQNQFVVPTSPAQPDPPVSGTADAWLLGGYSSPYEMGQMFTPLPVRTISGAIGPELTRFE